LGTAAIWTSCSLLRNSTCRAPAGQESFHVPFPCPGPRQLLPTLCLFAPAFSHPISFNPFSSISIGQRAHTPCLLGLRSANYGHSVLGSSQTGLTHNPVQVQIPPSSRIPPTVIRGGFEPGGGQVYRIALYVWSLRTSNTITHRHSYFVLGTECVWVSLCMYRVWHYLYTECVCVSLSMYEVCNYLYTEYTCIKYSNMNMCCTTGRRK
jgi:hypothetical protein